MNTLTTNFPLGQPVMSRELFNFAHDIHCIPDYPMLTRQGWMFNFLLHHPAFPHKLSTVSVPALTGDPKQALAERVEAIKAGWSINV